jgi:hypothetical protein
MCWSFKVSIYTFIASLIASSYLWIRNKKNDRLFGVYIFIVGLIQGIEALAWYSIEHKNKKLNIIAGTLLQVGIWLQFVILYCYMYYSTKNKLYLYAFIASILFLILRIKKNKVTLNCNFNKKLLTSNDIEKHCSLEWNWLSNKPLNNGTLLYIAGLLYPLLNIKDRRTKYMIMIPILNYIFSVYKFNNTKVWSGYWCLTSNIWIPIAIFL